jgi:hypothetical protein
MNINKKFIIIFGVSILLLIAIFGFKAYYQERISQTMPILPEDVSFRKTFDKNYPSSLEETILFNRICANIIVSGPDQEFEPLLCEIVKDNNYDDSDKYTSISSPLRIFSNLPVGQYITIAVNYSDLLQENVSIIPIDGSFNLCTITKPALINPFREELLSENQININSHNIVFPEGEVFCSKFFDLPSETLNLLINGFIPETNLFQAKIYLIPEDVTVNELLSQEFFANIENILKQYHLLWNVEKPTMLIINQN